MMDRDFHRKRRELLSPTPPQFVIISEASEGPTLAKAQEFVGGYVQMITLNNGDQLLFDEEATWKMGAQPVLYGPNAAATEYALERGATVLLPPGGNLLGPVLCLQGKARWS